MVNTIELRHDLKGLVQKGREILDLAAGEDRELTQEEKTKYERIEADIEKLEGRIEVEERQQEREKRMESLVEPVAEKRVEDRAAEERAAIEAWLKKGETRALQADLNTSGGYLVMPQQFVSDLIKAKDDLVFVRRLARVETVTSADSLGAAALDNDPADSTWTSEIATRSEDSTMSFGKRELTPHPLAKLLKVSDTLLMKTGGTAESIVRDRLAYKFAITEEKAFLVGTGARQPLGVFTAADQGISTSRDVSTGNAATAVTVDGLIEAKWSLKGQYWPNASWIFHRDVLKTIRKLKDGEGRYMVQPSVERGNAVNMLLESPVYMSEYASSTMTTGLYVGVIGDFSMYWIADSLGFRLKRLDELYAATAQVGFIGRGDTDGMPVLEEAFARVKLG